MAREAHSQSFGPGSGYMSASEDPSAGSPLWHPPVMSTSFVNYEEDGDSGVPVLSMPTSDFRPGPAPRAHPEVLSRYNHLAAPQRPAPSSGPLVQPPSRPLPAPAPAPASTHAPQRQATEPAPAPGQSSAAQTACFIAAGVLGGVLLLGLIGAAFVQCGLIANPCVQNRAGGRRRDGEDGGIDYAVGRSGFAATSAPPGSFAWP